MAWYDDPAKTSFVGVYANEKQMRWDADAAVKRGWEIQPESDEEEPMIGAPAKTRLTVTFARREDWLVNRKLEIATNLRETAARAADAKDARHVKAADDLARAEEAFFARADAAVSAPGFSREQAERDLLLALKNVIARRRDALRAKEEAIREMDAAISVGATEFVRSLALLTRARDSETRRLEFELALLPPQELVAKAAKEWRDAGERRDAAEEQLNRRIGEFEARDEALKERLAVRDELFASVRPAARQAP